MYDSNVTVFDLETTGFGFEAGIVQIAHANFTLGQLINGDPIEIEATLVNPECPIEPAATATHGISEDDVKDSPKISEVWSTIKKAFHTADMLAGFNSAKYDVPLLNANLQKRSLTTVDGKIDLDVMKIYRRITGSRKGKLVEVAELYGVSDAFTVYGPHDARGDVFATIKILQAMIKEHGLEDVLDLKPEQDLSGDVVELAKQYRNIKLEIEDREKKLTQLKKRLLDETDGEERVDTPYLTIVTQAGRTTVDYKSIVQTKGLDQDLELLSKFTKTSKPVRAIRLA